MSTITKERAKDILEFGAGRIISPITDDEIMEMARIALASLEAEAVAYTDAEELRFPHATSDMWRSPLGHGWDLPLYTAPPVPVSVPIEMDPITCHLDGVTETYADGWNACRAAMLQGAEPVSNRDELPDGWVACSERMPEDEQEVITYNIFGYRHVSFFDEHSGHFFDRLEGSPVDCVEHVLVSHWMPLPSPPVK